MVMVRRSRPCCEVSQLRSPWPQAVISIYMMVLVCSGWSVRFPLARAVVGFGPLPNQVGDEAGMDRWVQRARAVPAELRLLMIRVHKAPMDVRLTCGQCPQRGRPRAGRRCVAIVTTWSRAFSGRRAIPGRFSLKIWCL